MNIVQIPVQTDDSNNLARWEEVVCRTQVSVQTLPIGEMPFNGKLKSTQLGAVLLRHFRSTPIRYIRGEREIGRYPGDVFEVSLTLSGRTIFVQDGNEIVQNPGDVVMFDTCRPFDYLLPEGDDQIVLDIPGVLLREYLPNADRLTCTLLNGKSIFGGLVGKMFQDIEAMGAEAGEGFSARLGTAVVDMVAAAFDVETASRVSVSRAQLDLVEQVKTFVLENLSDSTLDVETIARANNVSVRSLHRLFAAQQRTTVMRWLWQQRLCASYKALAVGRSSRVSDVAMMYGFTNFSHFARSFKQTFGVLPQSLLRSRLK